MTSSNFHPEVSSCCNPVPSIWADGKVSLTLSTNVIPIADAFPFERSGLARIEIEALYKEFAPLIQRLIRQYALNGEGEPGNTGELYSLFACIVNAYNPQQGVPFRPYILRQLTGKTTPLSKAIEKLPLPQKQIIVDCYYHGRPREEIAQALEMSLASVDALLDESLKNLRVQIAGRQCGD